MSRFSNLVLAASTCALLFACAERNKGPDIASSSSDPSYAKRLPEDLTRSSERYDRASTEVDEINAKMAQYPEGLSDPDWGVVLEVYERADQEGRSSAYVAHQQEATVITDFHEQERKPLVRRVAASNEYVTKEKGCEVELWGATDRGLEKGIEERLEERRRADSEAHAIITEQEEALGKPNEKPLRDQVDEIRRASYVVHVGLALEEESMQRRADEASAARSALEDHLEKLKAAPKPNPDEIAKAEAALAALDPSVEQAKQRVEAGQKRRDELKKKYDAAFESLKQAVESKKDAQEKERQAEK